MNPAAAVLCLVVAVGTAAAAGHPPSCPETITGSDLVLQHAYAEFKRSVESSPLLRYLGRPLSCDARADGGAVRLVYESPTGARLEALRDPALELTELRLSEKVLSGPTALALLQRTERWAFGVKGCAIAWTRPSAREARPSPGRQELVYQGEACNCQARLVEEGGVLTGVIFRSAC